MRCGLQRINGLKRRLVPVAEEVNAIAIRGLKESEVATTRRCLLVMLDNLALDEALAPEPVGTARPAFRATALRTSSMLKS